MHSYLGHRPFWVQFLLFIGMAVGIFVVFNLIGLLILVGVTNLSLNELADREKWDFTNPDMVVFIRGMLLIQFFGLFLIPSVLFAAFSGQRPLRWLGIKKPIAPVYFLLGITALLVSIPLVEWLGLINQNINLPDKTEAWMQRMEEDAEKQIVFMLSKNSVKDLLLNLMFIAGCAAVGEELFFRGVLQKIFIGWFKSPWAGIIVASILFSAFHFQFFGFLPRLLLGILLGAAYWYSGSLWVPILGHLFYNGLFIIVAYYNPHLVTEEETSIFNASTILFPAIVSLIGIIGIVWYMRKKSTVTYSQVYPERTPADEFSF